LAVTADDCPQKLSKVIPDFFRDKPQP
jgi:hypothetical protein